MLPRFDQAQLVAEAQRDRALHAIAESVDTSAGPDGGIPIVLVSTLPWKRTDPIEFSVDFPLPEAPAAVTLEDGAGEEVPFSLLGAEDVHRRDVSPTELPKSVPVRRFRVGLVAENVPSAGVKTLWVRPAAWRPAAPSGVLRGARLLENDYLQVTVEPNGSLSVRDWVTGYTYTDWLVFADNGDAGDEYKHIAPLADRVHTSHGWSPAVTVVESGPSRASVEIAGTLALPRSTSPKERSADVVPCEIRTVVTLAAGVPRIECETTVVNRASDHRLRVLFPTDLATDRTQAEGWFDVVTRERVPAEWPHASATQPCHGFVAAGDGHRGLCVIPEGLPEYELLEDGRATLALTLMRCVGFLSRGAEAAGEDVTFESQMLGEFTFRYALAPYAGELMTSGVARHAECRRVPLQAVQTTRHAGPLSDGSSFLSVEPEQLIVTATKLSPCGRAMVVRLHNPTDTEVAAVLATGFPLGEAWTADLMERPLERLAAEPGSGVTFGVGPRKIVTILLQRAEA
jgi:hypothetical protein